MIPSLPAPNLSLISASVSPSNVTVWNVYFRVSNVNTQTASISVNLRPIQALTPDEKGMKAPGINDDDQYVAMAVNKERERKTNLCCTLPKISQV